MKNAIEKRLEFLLHRKQKILNELNERQIIDDKEVICFGKMLEDINFKITEVYLIKQTV